MSRLGSVFQRETVLWLTFVYGTCFNRRRNFAHISRSNGRNGHKSVRNLDSIN